MENYAVIATFPDPREAYYFRFKLGIEGIDAYIIETEKKENGEIIPLQVQVNLKNVEKAIDLLCEMRMAKDFQNIEEKIKNIRRILVPIDFSDYSYSAALFAFSIAKSINAEIKLLHIFKDPFMGGTFLGNRTSYENFTQNVMNEMFQMAQNNMVLFIDKLKQKLQEYNLEDVSYHYVLQKGKPEYQIVKISETYKPYMIVLGTKGVGQMPGD